ncbi:hypothetical protein D3C78_1160900 [compost metagenome]
MGFQRVGVNLLSRFANHHGHRSLAPLRVRSANHRDRRDRRVLADQAFELQRADPLSPRLDHVFDPVLDFHDAQGVD